MKTALTVTGASAFSKNLRSTGEILGRELESLLKQEARAACVSLSFQTLPYGFSPPTPKQQGRIAGDIRRVYTTREQISAVTELIKPRSQRLAMAFYYAATKGDSTRAARYMRMAGVQVENLDPGLHRAARTGPQGSVAKNAVPSQVVKPASLAKFTREKQGTIGTAKAGWYAAAKALGGRVRTNLTAADGKRSTAETIPAFVRKLAGKFGGLGGARVMPGRVEVFTNVTYADEALPQGSLEAAVSTARESFSASIQKAVSIAIKKTRRAA